MPRSNKSPAKAQRPKAIPFSVIKAQVAASRHDGDTTAAGKAIRAKIRASVRSGKAPKQVVAWVAKKGENADGNRYPDVTSKVVADFLGYAPKK